MQTQSILKVKLQPNISQSSFYDIELEGLRGAAALLVMLYHGFGMKILDSNYLPEGIIPYLSVGALSVYLFFMLSGYVMGITYHDPQKFKTSSYLRKRIIRLYPIYLLTFGLVVLNSSPSIKDLVGGLLMLQNDHIQNWPHVIMGPEWSINYEAFYYLLFILIILSKPNLIILIAIVFSMAISGYYGIIIPSFLSDYCFGLLFWMAGLWIAWNCPYGNQVKFNFISIVFLLLCYQHLQPGAIVLKGLKIDSKIADLASPFGHGLGLKTLLFLPLCFYIIATIAKRKFRFEFMLKLGVYLLPLPFFLFLTITHRLTEDIRWITCLTFYLLSFITITEKTLSTKLLKSLSFVGQISYALYLFHMPLAYVITTNISGEGNGYYYWMKFCIWMGLTVALSYLAEKVLQPKIKTFLS